MRIALGVEYNGYSYNGWQYQPNLPANKTIQGALETAISKIANEPIFLHCAGRTDANVHALGQVVHFDTRAKRHVDAWIWGTNTHLPPAIIVHWSRQVDYSFHARFTACSRRYQYIIYNHPIRPAILNTRATWYYYPLDETRMQEAAHYLLGENDFSSFRSSQCSSKTPMRNVTYISVKRVNRYVIIEIEANAFLHHMVRNIAGCLMKVGTGVQDPPWMQTVLSAKSRKAAAETAAADGLYLTQVSYPEPYIFPVSSSLFLL